ncbi:MAG TPA: hypothetical protein VNE39_07105 [Planctomycetota bacterium]|nr:hypothetical protein [Planctomycetota bacterium]
MADTCCKGVVRGGTVVLESKARLPEGAGVLVTPLRETRGSAQAILDALDASPPVTHEDVEELLRLIKEGKRPARSRDPFARNRKKRTP